MKYYIVMERKGRKMYKKYKCIEGWAKNRDECWKFSKQGAKNIVEQYKKMKTMQDAQFYIEPAQE